MVKKILLICILLVAALLLVYIGVNARQAKVWHIQSIKISHGVASIDFSGDSGMEDCNWIHWNKRNTGCSEEQHQALYRIFTLIPTIRDVEVSINGKGDCYRCQ